jgi:hypothetical protein
MRSRRIPRWKDIVGTLVAGLWPVAVTLAALRNPGKYNPFAFYSGLGNVNASTLKGQPTIDPNIYYTSYTLGVRAASMLVHGHLPWWNPFQGLGAPLIGEMQSAGLFPFTPLLLLRDGSLIFHLSLLVVAGVATYWLLREFRFGPLISSAGAMVFATCGTFAWIANAAFNPVCFLPLLVLGVERSRRAAVEGKGAGWRWLAVGTALAIAAGFLEVATVGLLLAAAVAIERGWTLPRDRVVAFVRKLAAGVGLGLAVAAPVLVAFHDYISVGYLGTHTVDVAGRHMAPPGVAMTFAPYLFGRIDANPFPLVQATWGAIGGYAGFGLFSLAVASLFGRRDRGLRLTLFGWVVVTLGDSLGLPVFHSLFAITPYIQHLYLYRYFAPTWELALVLLAAFALRDLATSSRAEALIAVTTGVIVTALLLLLGIAVAPQSVSLSRALEPSSFRFALVIVVAVAAGLLLATLAPSRFRGALVALVVVTEAAMLFAIPLLSWPSSIQIDQGAVAFITTNVNTQRMFGLGVPSPNFGSQVGSPQLNVADLPIPKPLVAIIHALDPTETVNQFFGVYPGTPGTPGFDDQVLARISLYERFGVQYIVTPASSTIFSATPSVTLVYKGPQVAIYGLSNPTPLASAAGCTVTTVHQDQYMTECHASSILLRNELAMPGWTATVNGAAVPVVSKDRLQTVPVPKGRAVVSLTFLPPGETLAFTAAILGVLAFLVPWELLASRRRRRPGVLRGTVHDTAPTSVVYLDLPEPLDHPTGVVDVSGGYVEGATQAVPIVAAPATGWPRHDDPPTLAVPMDATGTAGDEDGD